MPQILDQRLWPVRFRGNKVLEKYSICTAELCKQLVFLGLGGCANPYVLGKTPRLSPSSVRITERPRRHFFGSRER